MKRELIKLKSKKLNLSNEEIRNYICPRCKKEFKSNENFAPPQEGELCVNCYWDIMEDNNV